MLERRLRRLESDIRQVEAVRESNATLLSRLLHDLEEERAKSQRLLLNVLPQRIIDRLAAGETLIADAHDDVTVLFSDIVDFTTISASTPPADLVRELNELFTGFDAICDRVGVDKIKTVGDAYLAVGGLAGDGVAGEVAIADLALGMIDFMAAHALRTDAGAGPGTNAAAAHGPWRIRIGLHAGPIVAGVVGSSKFAYDVWGDTVNTASRLESTSEPGRIQVSTDLARRLEPLFVVERRGLTELKGKGRSETYWLDRRRTSLVG